MYSSERVKKKVKKYKITYFIEITPGIKISEGNENMLDKEFPKYTMLLINKIFKNLEKNIQEKYDDKYKLN